MKTQRLCVGWFVAGLLTGVLTAFVLYYHSGVTWVNGYTQAVYDQGYADGRVNLLGEE